ncbi:MAG: SPFH domain-containing protein [Bacteroidales bacterium]|jgi:regulator of protease activity HflC (stomatin/prohibitin superfamily)|nr:SPFH domain-containing protein [Bacteroidales bacterium]MBR3987352.1 SPFH domain-containing protein [Bacteroidales bacterium]
METKEFTKKMTVANNGFIHLIINILILVLTIILAATTASEGFAIMVCCLGCIVYTLHIIGFMTIQPNLSRVLTFFGKYRGTVVDNGFFWVNPFYAKRRISLRARNMDVPPIKVNDKNGNPIMIGLVLVWKIKDTYKACFDIEVDSTTTIDKEGVKTTKSNGYDNFVNVQSDAALRKVAGLYAYDNIDHHSEELTLRSGGEEINNRLEEELRSRLNIAGIEVVEARINYLAYAAEIASVMLRRQQAEAIISAREKIVDGAVSMVDLALKKLSKEHIVELDEERKAAMVSNLLVVLCADESASPVINTGTLYN